MNFTELYNALAESASNTQKVSLLEQYFRNAPAAEVGWAIYLLRGGKLSRVVSTTELRRWAADLAGLPLWLVEESYQVVGDLAETVALLVAQHTARPNTAALTTTQETSSRPLLSTWCTALQALRGADEATRGAMLRHWWQILPMPECLVFNKLITGGLRIGVSRGMVGRALSRVVGVDPQVITHKLIAMREPELFSLALLAPPGPSGVVTDSVVAGAVDCTPYPFLLAHPLSGEIKELGAPADWLAEWKWDGMRAQLVRRAESLAVWSRGEELVSESFPELQELQAELPAGTVIDGELVVWHTDQVGPFSELQTRLQRRAVSPKILKSHPVRMIAYDLLEWQGRDLRTAPLLHRRNLLIELLTAGKISPHLVQLSAQLPFQSWEQLALLRGAARAHRAEGVMIKSLAAPYGVGRCRGVWWKWKVDPFSVDGVLLYAQRGHGRRANLYTDFTFGVWDGEHLVPFAKAYSGLTNAELAQIDAFVRAHRRERFGPVASVEPSLVFEIAFEGIQRSSRHKAGFAVRFPRIVRWRTDKEPHEADTLADLRRLLDA